MGVEFRNFKRLWYTIYYDGYSFGDFKIFHYTILQLHVCHIWLSLVLAWNLPEK